uniref:Uncharacterized protein n=1 Tax=Hyaloperonospora arabidopsidis (strain Emoy2) TaxID=559515 RepID=M4BZB6_HYAAE
MGDITARANTSHHLPPTGTILIGTKVGDQEHYLLIDDVLHVPDSKHSLFSPGKAIEHGLDISSSTNMELWYLVEELRLSKQSFLIELGNLHHPR